MNPTMPHFPIPYLGLKLNSNCDCAGREANDQHHKIN